MSHQFDSHRELLDLIRDGAPASRRSCATSGRAATASRQSASCQALWCRRSRPGPALGGTKFTVAAAAMANLGDDAFDLARPVSGGDGLVDHRRDLYKYARSSEAATRLAKAEACNAALEGLETLVHFGQIPVADAVVQYQQQIAEIPFIPELLGYTGAGSHRHVPPPPQ